MRIKIPDNLSSAPERLIKRCGYAEIRDREGRTSFVRRLRGYRYPRFHVYIEGNFFNLHLDQKAPVYKGVAAHSGEYEGKILEEEAEKIMKYIKKIVNL